MTTIDWIGTFAGTLTTVAFIPQVLKTWRSRSAHDISLFMFILFSTGVLLWLIYGAVLGSWPIIITNGLTLLLALSMLHLKVMAMVAERRRLRQAGQRAL